MSWDLVHYTRVCEACEDKDTTREETTVEANTRAPYEIVIYLVQEERKHKEEVQTQRSL